VGIGQGNEQKMAGIGGIKMPRRIKNPKDIDSPMMVKYYGAKGGKDSLW